MHCRDIKPEEEPIGELAKTIEIYDSVDSTLRYPRRYVSFINTFEKIIAQKKIGITEQQQRIQVGTLCTLMLPFK